MINVYVQNSDYSVVYLSLFQIQNIVAKIGVQRTEYLLSTRRHRGKPEEAHVASMPQTRCTFLGYKYMLEPGTQNHPDNLTNTVLRNPTLTTIKALPGELPIILKWDVKILKWRQPCARAFWLKTVYNLGDRIENTLVPNDYAVGIWKKTKENLFIYHSVPYFVNQSSNNV